MYQTTIGERILDVVRATPGCNLEEVTRQLPDLPWSQVFREVVTLRWLGQLELNESTLGLTTTLSPSSTT